MSCRLFERIINTMKPSKETEEPSYPYESPDSESQQTSESMPDEIEDTLEYSEASEEPSPEFQEAVNPAHPYQCQD